MFTRRGEQAQRVPQAGQLGQDFSLSEGLGEGGLQLPGQQFRQLAALLLPEEDGLDVRGDEVPLGVPDHSN